MLTDLEKYDAEILRAAKLESEAKQIRERVRRELGIECHARGGDKTKPPWIRPRKSRKYYHSVLELIEKTQDMPTLDRPLSGDRED